jgi:hypothetical protein
MRFAIACFVAVLAVPFAPPASSAQDLKKGVTDRAHVDADFHLQGEYAGCVLFADGWQRRVGLQVVALGDGKFDALWHQGGLPGNGYDGSSRRKLAGWRTGSTVPAVSKDSTVPAILNVSAVSTSLTGSSTNPTAVLIGEGLMIELQAGAPAVVKNSAGGLLGSLQPQLRHSQFEGAAPPANAILLFDGKNTDRLKNAKITSDGLLEIGCETKEAYQNFTLHAEFRIPYMPYARGQGRGNSGCYLQKRYEVQVLDSFGLELQFNDCASLYRFKAPDLNMSFPPLSWQTYDIDFTAPKFDAAGKRTTKGRITVRHNGVVVHNNLELANKTGGGSPEGPNPLPILLQNHGNPVHFRNLWLVDHDAPSSACPTGCSPVAAASADCGGPPAPACCVVAGHRRHPRLHLFRCR